MTREDDHYPPGSLVSLLDSEFVTRPTRAALKRRLRPVEAHEMLLDQTGIALLDAICTRLIPQPDRAEPIDIAARLHAGVATGAGDGWRYAVLPLDSIALVLGVAAIDETARAIAGESFLDLDGEARDRVLGAIQRGEAPGATWKALDPRRWFEELLTATTEIYFAHPLAQEEIGYVGMADALGWSEVGLGARAAYEPLALPAK